MKQFKIIDFWMNVILIIAFTIYGFCQGDAGFFISYFVVGAWQLTSILVHYYKDWFTEKDNARRTYQTIVIVVFITAALGFVIPGLLFFLAYILLYISPFMAIYYTRICYKEVFVKMQRPLALLK